MFDSIYQCSLIVIYIYLYRNFFFVNFKLNTLICISLDKDIFMLINMAQKPKSSNIGNLSMNLAKLGTTVIKWSNMKVKIKYM